jgi:hypothetical protein
MPDFGHDPRLDLYPELQGEPHTPPAAGANADAAYPPPAQAHKVRSGSGLSVRGTQMPPPPQPVDPENLSLQELRRLANAALRKENL